MRLLVLPIVFALLGFIFSARPWIKFLDRQSPPVGLLIYYTIIFTTLMLLQHFGLIVADVKFDSVAHALGALLIIFSFFVIFSWESYYIAQVVDDVSEDATQQRATSTSVVSNVYLESEDGSVYYFWYNIMGYSVELSRKLTYILTPFVLTILGLLLIKNRQVRISPL